MIQSFYLEIWFQSGIREIKLIWWNFSKLSFLNYLRKFKVYNKIIKLLNQSIKSELLFAEERSSVTFREQTDMTNGHGMLLHSNGNAERISEEYRNGFDQSQPPVSKSILKLLPSKKNLRALVYKYLREYTFNQIWAL